jgi:epoxyqueuosine reductase
MTAAELARRAAELGLDVAGAAAAAPYDETEEHILERRERGLFAGMRFTMAQPEVSCHPELLLDGEARTVVSAALCYWVDGPEPATGEGRLPRYAWRDHYALLRERLDALGRSLGGRYRVLVDENQHVDREGAVRAGIGFYGKNTMLITREHGSWVVLGTLVTDVEIEPTAPLELDCGRCRLCIDACPTGALDEPGVLDSTRCLSYWTQAPAPVPEEYRADLGTSVYGCDICQDVCPWNRGIEKRRGEESLPAESVPNVSLVDWLTRDGSELVQELDRLYVPRNDPRWLRRNALYAAGNADSAELLPLVEEWAVSDDPVLADAAQWAAAQIEFVLNHRNGSPERTVSDDPLRMLAHELRSPVAALAAIAEGYADADAERRGRLLELAEAATASIERLLVDADAGSLALERLDLSSLAVDAVDTARLTGARIDAEIEPGLLVDGDATRLRQALDNLIDNAAGHAPEETVVQVTVRGDGAEVVVGIADEGAGVPPGELLRIFEPGVRATEERPGSGLGLAVVRAVALAHGGKAEVQSSPGQGATFRLVLPAASGGR